MKNNLLKKLYKHKKSTTKPVINSKSNERKGLLSNRTTTLITAATTILNIIISSSCILYSVHVQKTSNSFNFKDTEYVRKQKIFDSIIEEIGESESYLHDKWIDCHSQAVKNKIKHLHELHAQFYHHIYKTIVYIEQYLATDNLSNLSNIRFSLVDTLNIYKSKEGIFEQCSVESENTFSDEKFKDSRTKLFNDIWKESDRLQMIRDEKT